MRCLVTGCAGFIGSHLVEKLVELGFETVGVDCFTDYYSRTIKEANLNDLLANKLFTFIEANLLDANLIDLLDGVDCVFHEAAQAGVRTSWGKDFRTYMENNVLATQCLLEAAREVNLQKLIYASSSSVYGNAETYPTSEETIPKPISPYGVTKLAGEHLCLLYWRNFEVPVSILRYFTVYGPRQRPDMAFFKFITAMLKGRGITIYGNGQQTRDFTFISDIVHANLLAMEADVVGEVINIGGGSRVTVNEIIDMLGEITGNHTSIKYIEEQKGDVRNTAADIRKPQKTLGYQPEVAIQQGLASQISYVADASV